LNVLSGGINDSSNLGLAQWTATAQYKNTLFSNGHAQCKNALNFFRAMSRNAMAQVFVLLDLYMPPVTILTSDKMHIDKKLERHFLEIKNSNVKNHTGFGWGNQLKPILIN